MLGVVNQHLAARGQMVLVKEDVARDDAHGANARGLVFHDFDHAVAGNLVVKVVYLPDRENQDFLTVGGIEEVNSTRLEPGVDPVAEAQA